MNKLNRPGAYSLGLILSLGICIPVQADDTEIYVVDSNAIDSSIQPNVLFILDTSGSMAATVQTQAKYDPGFEYAGSCDKTQVYYREGAGGDLPDCSTSDRFFMRINNLCDWSTRVMSITGVAIGKFAQHDTTDSRWKPMSSTLEGQTVYKVECVEDSGVHGDGVDLLKLYAMDLGPWVENANQQISWGAQDAYTFYDANYLNYVSSPPSKTSTRIEILQEVTKLVLQSISGINVGLMRFSNNHSGDPLETRAEGGMVIHQMEDVTTATATLMATVDTLVPDGFTPLSETMYEAGLYYQGLPVDFGIDSRGDFHEPLPSIPESRVDADQSLYKSPIALSCQENFVVLISDGDPLADTNANARIQAQPDFSTLIGPACDGTGEGACLDDMTEYLFEGDISNQHDGRQYASTYTVGFTIDSEILRDAAESGGGQYYFTEDTASLSAALTQTILEILDTSATFTAPSISVNAFNRTRNLNDLFISVFESAGTEHWPGNMKKYSLKNGVIVDADDKPAVDPNTGFFTTSARSFWSVGTDGSEVERGGAANRLPIPLFRNLYTYTGDYPVALGGSALTGNKNQLDNGNGALTKSLLNIGGLGDPKKVALIRWARGTDVLDEDQDGDTNDTRHVMGDPLHSKPASVIYGGTATAPDINDAVIYSATNDGYLHAFDIVTGDELWAFVPKEHLGQLKKLYTDPTTADKHYGIDGDLRALTIDVNRNGIIEPLDGDHVYLYFGMRRGGYQYYALDVTSKTNPILMWVKDASELPHLSQTWSAPVATKINIAGANQNPDKHVLVFGGGYDGTQDNTNYTVDLFGNTIYMVDAVSGDLLWWAGNDPAANLTLPAMNNSIPGDIRVLDVNSDGLADRMYAADMGGRVFRFDIFNGQFANTLVTGGVFASLGAADLAAPTLADTRRFYYAPDTAVISSGGQRFLNLAIGSGYRAHPLETGVNDRFYSLRDFELFRQMSQFQYDALVPITDSDPALVDITADPSATLPANAQGWKLKLTEFGEKVLAESQTFDSKIFFTTYSPEIVTNSCRPTPGVNRLYAISAVNAAPFTDLDQDGDLGGLDTSDRSRTLNAGGIAPEVVFLFPSADDGTCVGSQCAPRPECIVGLEVCDPGFENSPIRTFWNQAGAE